MARRESIQSGPGSQALIVDLIRSAGPISRTELTQATGLTQPSVSNIVRRLIEAGLVRESGRTASQGGKPRTLLEINASAKYGIGIQLGFESITLVATDVRGGVVGRQLVNGAGSAPPDEVTARIATLYRGFVDAVDLLPSSIAGVAVVAPGPIAQVGGVLLGPPTLSRWDEFPLKQALQSAIDAPVIVDNDAAAAAVGEFWSRQVSRTESFACIYMGTGIGAGMVLDSALYRGSSSNAGELGHISIDADGIPCHCGNRGCLERYAAPEAVMQAAHDVRGALSDLRLGFDPETLGRDFDQLARAAISGHATALGLLQRSADHIASATVTLANLLDLDRLVLAGPGMAVAGSLYTRTIRSRLEQSFFARRAHPILVELSANPRDTAAIGAASLVLQGTIAPGHGPSLG
ncbi:ROK family transcriptional regulator [Microbacterium sp. CCH5-D1]|uniref:ROK family transcriptional regulator n=1 Tax=Microbacterium sp. CCH5-D1 TaxID=1768780 RepID=UPI000AA28D4D|nr:ROK family transcriptional regulator [Microbacterium sp. CCH5-D1]